jgi:fatty-acyl-CoA synthase
MTSQVTDPIVSWGREIPDEAAIVFGGRAVTYRELDGWTGRVAARFAAAGVDVGDRVGVIGANSVEWCIAALGVLRAGAILVPLNVRLLRGELAGLVADATPKLVVADADRVATMQGISAAGPHFDVVDQSFVTEVREGDARPFRRAVDASSPAVIVFTSGTTAKPKGVVFSHATTLGFIFEWSLIEPDFTRGMRLLMPLPLHGAPGTLWGLIHTLVHGGTFYVEPGFVPADTVRALAEHRITCFVGVPLLYEAMAATPDFDEADLSHLRVTHVGGARVSVGLLRRWQEKGVLLRQIYGLTEGGGSVTVTPREYALERPESCGRGGVFTRVKTVTPDGTECEPGEPGEILIQGPAVTPGYWNNEEATRETIVDGWLRTGDVGVIDDEGFLRMVDRMKDMIISGGINLSPTEIENTIAELDEIEEVAVIPAADDRFGETPAAVVRFREGSALPVDKLIAHCDARLADFKVPRYVVTVTEPLPRLASGKLAKRVLKEQYANIRSTHPRLR